MTLYLGTEKVTPTITTGSGSVNIQSLNVTPSVESQTITPPLGVDGFSPINVSAVTSSIDSNISAENIKKDVTILGVTGSYEGSGGSETKFGLGIDSFIGDTVNGVLQTPTLKETDLIFTGITDLGFNALAYAFYAKGITSVTFPDLVNITNDMQGLSSAFRQCNLLTNISFPLLESVTTFGVFMNAFSENWTDTNNLLVSFPELTTISGSEAFSNAFNNNNALKSISFPNLTTISGDRGFYNTFSYCRYLTSVSLPKLATVGQYSMIGTFANCESLTRIDFPSLTSVQNNSFQDNEGSWEKIFRDCQNLTEIHFRADMANVIPTMIGYSEKWGASNATIYFDLGSATVNFEITPSQDTSIYADGTLVVNNTIKLGANSEHTYTIINPNYPIYYGTVMVGAEGSTTTVTKDITSVSGHKLTINTNVSDCTVTFDYNGLKKSATTVTSTSYESDDLYSEFSITVGYTVSKEGYITKSGTIAFNNSDVSINVELKSNDLDLTNYTYTLDENNNAILTGYKGPEVTTLVLPSMEE